MFHSPVYRASRELFSAEMDVQHLYNLIVIDSDFAVLSFEGGKDGCNLSHASIHFNDAKCFVKDLSFDETSH